MAQHLADRHYATLAAHERFTLTMEAMARRDDRETDRLADTCPRFTYRCEDVAFRDRMRRSYMIAYRVCLNMRDGLAQIRMARLFHEQAGNFAGASIRVAQVAFLYGREYGKWEAGVIDSVELPDARALADAVAANPDLALQLEELRQVTQDAMRTAAATLREAVGEVHAVDLLSQWEGFERFCREVLEMDALVLFRAYGLGSDSPADEIGALYPDARAEEASVVEWARRWTRTWNRRFGPGGQAP